MNRRKRLIALTLIALSIGLLLWNNARNESFFRHDGYVFGTTYSIRYQAEKEYKDSILLCLKEVDNALSMFNEYSTLSLINRNQSVVIDPDFLTVFTQACQVSDLSNGAFDMTVAPLVNAWGFGFENKADMSPAKVDSLLALVGYKKIRLEDGNIVKDNPDIRLDANAIAKGYACDKVARFLQRKGCTNILVDIGGEVVAHGRNEKGSPWAIGINKPIDDTTGTIQELQDIIHTEDIAMATSGNYRNFYYEGTERRSHTIDPRTGYPVNHNLLSATVVASSCMRADALATACMVLGSQEALTMIEQTDDAACYLIVSGKGNQNKIIKSHKWKKLFPDRSK